MLSRIDRYLIREAMPPFVFGLLLYGGLAAVSAVLPRLQWIVGTPLLDLAWWIVLLLPQALVMTAPIALVLAVLLSFGRLGTDQELTAMQAGAVPLRRAALVFVVLGAVAAASSLAASQWLVPRANMAVVDVYWRLTADRSGLFRLLGQQLPVGELSLTFAQATRDDTLLDVRVERWDGDVLTLIRAERGRFEDEALVLYGHRTQRLDLAALDGVSAEASETLRALVRLDARGADPDAPLTLTLSLSQDELVARFSGGGFEDARSLSDLRAASLDADLPFGQRRFAAVLLQRKLAEGVANLTLLLVAVPLSLSYARSRGVAFGLSLVVTLAWYLLLTFGQLMAQTGALPVWLGPWAGTVGLALVGTVMLLRLRSA
ncbi:MAG: YjgP/YjgQ family permease [Trueperaceae bacterium]|nr:MAG: YjgP/YjgQ family permease [Trueperaceae bacterium]